MIEEPNYELACQIAIIGAGPAGSTAAYYLALAGLDVFLVDRATFPRDKICGDLLGTQALDELTMLGIDPVIEWRGRVSTVTRSSGVSCEGIERTFMPSSSHYVIRRHDFDNTLRLGAISVGARPLTFRFKSLERDKLGGARLEGITSSGCTRKIHAEVVVFANGSQATNTKGTLSYPDDRLSVAGRAYYQDVEVQDHTSEFYYLAHLPLHYGWLFPVSGGVANVGIITDVRSQKNMRVRLDIALDRMIAEVPSARRALGGAKRVSPFNSALLPTAARSVRLVEDGMFYLGDAAGLADCFNGEGIGPAMFSGRVAAETILSAWRGGCLRREHFDSYRERILARYGETYDAGEKMFKARQFASQLALGLG